ncbi:MAG: hydrolase [Planctomycetes bacterium RBG_13_63_9]|nr:MAG: hydrolase [Planctomycetes bacterium RBG_13_63_9]
MSDPPASAHLTGQLVFLGTGTSHGVPVIGCGCPTCTSAEPKNQRTRCSVVLGLPEGNLLVDSPPDLRMQLLRERIGMIHAVLYTHEHADHLFGLDDLRVFARYLGEDLPVYCDHQVEQRIRRAYDYAFDPVARQYPAGGVPRLALRPVTGEPLEILGARVVPIPLRHGRFSSWGYRLGNLAYCTDTNGIPPGSLPLLADLDVLILDCLRQRPHATHYSLDEAIETARQLAARRTLFTHMCHDLEHKAINASLPPGMELAYDGMRIPLRST